jgi:hypothetical protein
MVCAFESVGRGLAIGVRWAACSGVLGDACVLTMRVPCLAIVIPVRSAAMLLASWYRSSGCFLMHVVMMVRSGPSIIEVSGSTWTML